MMKTNIHSKFPCLLALVIGAAVSACGGSSNKSTTVTTPVIPTNPSSPDSNELGISAVPNSLSTTYTAALNFDRYTSYDAPNGKSIHILAQNEVSSNQIVRARNILTHYLTNLPGSQYGSDKSEVANKMANNGAVLLLLNGVDDGTNAAAQLDGQPLYYGEMQVEGSDWYINQNYDHRDASFEEILHLVHDYGIGVDQNEKFVGVLPEFQADIRAAQTTAVNSKLWAWSQDFANWLQELSAENSLTQEYLASVIDSYYGLWGAYTGEYGMWGGYIAKTRSDIIDKDPEGASLMDNKFFHSYLTYNARIDESFSGDFSLRLDQSKPYTYHAQYLKDVTLTGDKDSNIIVNAMDNFLTGNSGNNTVIFSGDSSEYSITLSSNQVVVEDLQDNRDGKNTIAGVEILKFKDTSIETTSL
mgnify:CR=1 FL=1